MHTVTLLPGDGIGPEVIDAAVRVVAATGVGIRWEHHEVGRRRLERDGDPLPNEVVESARLNGVALKGPVATSAGQSGFPSVNLSLRRRLGIFAQARPVWLSPRWAVAPLDVVVIRETTEDLYAGIEAASGSSTARDLIAALAPAGHSVDPSAGLSVKLTTAAATRRAVEYAFRYAEEHGRRKVTVVHKATVQRATDGLFLETAQQMAERHPSVAFDDCLVDSLCARLIRSPAELDVLVMSNLYGDIVADVAAALAGGIGLVGGVNVGDGVLLFEPAHGTAPRHAGLGRANPTGAILSAALMLRALGELRAADAVEAAVAHVLAEGRTVTYDVVAARGEGVPSTTSAMAEAVADAVTEALG